MNDGARLKASASNVTRPAAKLALRNAKNQYDATIGSKIPPPPPAAKTLAREFGESGENQSNFVLTKPCGLCCLGLIFE